MHHFGTIDAIVVAVYLVGIAALGIVQAVKIRSSGDYFAGGRKFGKWLMVMHALGTGTHADDPVGVAGACYKWGLPGIWYTYGYLFVTPFYWIIAPFFRRSRYITTADFFEARFGRGLGLLYAVMGILIFSINTGTLLKGTGTIVSSVTQGTVSEWTAILVMTVVFVGYGFAGGLIATVITESVQGVLIVVMSLILVPFGLLAIGGFRGLHQLVSAGMFTLHAPSEITIPWIIVTSFMMLIGIVSQPHIMEVCSTGKTEFEGRVGFTYGNFIKRFCAMGWAFTGLIVVAMVATHQLPGLEKREEAFGTAIRVLLPQGMTGLMFAAVLAAQMSTLSAFMVAGSALLSRNIYARYLEPGASDQQVLAVGRWGGLLVPALGLAFAFMVTGVAEGLTIFWAVSSFTGVFMWFGVLWKRTNALGAWISCGLMTVIWLWLGPIPVELHNKGLLTLVWWLGHFGEKGQLPLLVLSYLPVGIVVLVAGSLLGKRTDSEALRQFYLLIKTPVGREEELAKQGVNVVYAGSTEPHPWEIKHPVGVNVGGFLIGLVLSLVILGIIWGLAQIGK
jgi:Na+/proline symporter